jgi:hypothetical protein
MTRIDVEVLRLAHLAALTIERGSHDTYRRSRVTAAHALMALGRTWDGTPDGTPERAAARVALHTAGLAEHIAYAGYLQAAHERHEAYVAWMDATVELFEQSHAPQRTLPRVTALRLTA